jgi:hypothetical protein
MFTTIITIIFSKIKSCFSHEDKRKTWTVSQQWKYIFFHYFTKRNGYWIRKFFSGTHSPQTKVNICDKIDGTGKLP